MIPRRLEQSELLDGDQVSRAEIDQNLDDIARINGLIGTRAALIAAFEKLAPDPCTVLDLGTGAGDLIGTLLHQQRRLSIIGADLRSDVLAHARNRNAAPKICWLQLEGSMLPLADQSIDVILCSQMAHHLSSSALQKMLTEMQRVSRIGFILLDLERSRLAHLAIWLLTRIISRNRLTRYDGPLSARRAYTRSEIVDLAQSVGVRLVVQSVFPFRWIATCYREAKK